MIITLFFFLLTMGSCTPTSSNENLNEKPVYHPNASCSIFLYMCGSNLESRQGLAGKDIDELLEADIPDNVNVILETGGAKKWHSHNIASDKLQRYLIKNHELILIDETENADMGSAEVFHDWLKWATDNYISERNVLVIWDHGGNATEGVCYDENYGFKGLKQSELSTAFRNWGISKEKIQREYPKIDMIIFDTCFMGNIETISWLKDYFYYMIASEVIMPGGGLDYRVIAEEFAKNDDESYGRVICDSFRAECEESGQAEKTELSLYDLTQAEEAVSVLESVFKKEIAERRKSIKHLTPQELGELSFQDLLSSSAKHNSVIENSIKFNAIDLKNLIDDECSDEESMKSADQALERLVCYHVGEVKDHSRAETDPDYGRARCTGVSLYYPLQFDRDELTQYIEICPVKNYASLLENLYLKEKMELAFEDSGSINADDRFEITLTEESKPHLNYLIGKLWKQSKDGNYYYLLGEKTFFLTEKQKTLTFYDRFNGTWYHLNGYPLTGEGYWDNGKDMFHARIRFNGEETLYNFLSRYDLVNEPKISFGYVGNQFDENGLVNRLYRLLKKGDVVTILSNNPETENIEFTVDSITLKPQLKMLEPGLYRFQFTAVALDESRLDSDYAIFEVTENGAKAVNIIRNSR